MIFSLPDAYPKPKSITKENKMNARSLWKFDPQRLTLVYDDYEIDLETCTTSAAVLDWIMQVAGKTFATDHVLAALVRDLFWILAPQATLCSTGIEKGPIDVRAAVTKRRRTRPHLPQFQPPEPVA
jgi:hypothetical protein